MGQLLLLVVAAAWAAVLLPPLLRSRVENRPNSSVSDFRNQLSRLQRAMPTRGVAVRTMGRPLAPSTLSRPAASGRPGQPAGARTSAGAVSSRIAGQSNTGRPSRADARMHEATLRQRSHGDATASKGIARPGTGVIGEVKRRRANVLFVLVLTTICAGFLAATTDSKAMVYVFALAMLALGGYVYLLVTMNQRETYARGYEAEYRAAPRSPRRTAPPRRGAEPASRRSGYDLDEYDGYERSATRAPARQRRVAQPPPDRQAPDRQAPDRQAQYAADFPGAGVSGQYAMPDRGHDRDGFGWDVPAHEPARRAPARNGRHATGQQQAVRRRHFSQAG
jgi:hypothetical protein